MDEHIRLVHEGDLATAAACTLEGIAHDALDPECGVNALLGRNLVDRALAKHAARADVGTLGALTAHDEVDLLGALACDRPCHSRVQLHGSQVHVVVHHETKGQQHSALEDAGCDRRITDCPEQDRVLRAELRNDLVGQQFAGGVVTPGSEVVLRGFDGDVGIRRDCEEDLHGLRDNLRADTVAGDQCKVQGA